MLKCEFCGRDLKNQGAKNLHQRACEKNPKNIEEPEKYNKNENKENKKCEHTLILLDPKYLSQKRAMNDGYSAVCIKCKDLV